MSKEMVKFWKAIGKVGRFECKECDFKINSCENLTLHILSMGLGLTIEKARQKLYVGTPGPRLCMSAGLPLYKH